MLRIEQLPIAHMLEGMLKKIVIQECVSWIGLQHRNATGEGRPEGDGHSGKRNEQPMQCGLGWLGEGSRGHAVGQLFSV